MRPRTVKGPRCAFPGCDKPATTTRRFYGARLPACDACAVNLDSKAPEASALLDWSDPIARKRWLDGLRIAFDDADAVTRDLLRPLRQRELGHLHHAANYDQVRDQILQAFDFAGAAEDERGDPAGSGGAGAE